jgi:hypothetical protein
VPRQPDFITDNTALVDAVFRVFLANGNRPMSPLELEQEIGTTGKYDITNTRWCESV